MKRTNIYITDNQQERFRAIAEAKGIPVSELIRRVLDQWLEENDTAAMGKRRKKKGGV